MALLEYILLALVGSTTVSAPAGITPSSPPTPTLDADAIVQPNGGGVGYFEKKPAVKNASQGRTASKVVARHHRTSRRRRHTTKVIESGKKATKTRQ